MKSIANPEPQASLALGNQKLARRMRSLVQLAPLLAIVILSSILSTSVQGQTNDDPISLDSIKLAVKKVKYKTVGDVELHLHLFYPPDHKASDRRSAIVFFFGGGWNGGTPEQFYKQAWYLSQRGMVTACAEYRVKSRNQTTPIECVKDGKSAMRYMRSHAKEMGIDPERIAAAGGSAGGHVAAATATVTEFNEEGEDTSVSAIPCALVLFNPVLDNGPDGWGHDRVKEYWQKISPMHNVKNPATPTMFFLGSKDNLIPVSVAHRFKKKVEDNQGRCDLQIAPDQGHGYFNRGEWFLKTLTRADEFLESLDLLEGKPSVEKAFSQAWDRLPACH